MASGTGFACQDETRTPGERRFDDIIELQRLGMLEQSMLVKVFMMLVALGTPEIRQALFQKWFARAAEPAKRKNITKEQMIVLWFLSLYNPVGDLFNLGADCRMASAELVCARLIEAVFQCETRAGDQYASVTEPTVEKIYAKLKADGWNPFPPAPADDAIE